MALGVTFLGDDQFAIGNVPARLAQLTPDTSYPTGGYAVTGQNFGESAAGGMLPAANGMRGYIQVGTNTSAALYTTVFNAQTGKIEFITAGSQVAGGTDLSALIVYALGLFAGF